MALIHNANLDDFSKQMTADTLNIFDLIWPKIDKSKKESQQFMRDIFEINVMDKKRYRIKSIKDNIEFMIKYLKKAKTSS